MAADLVVLELLRDGLKTGDDGTARVDLDDEKSTKQLDEYLRTAAQRDGRAEVTEYALRVLDRHGNRVLVDNFRLTNR